MLKSLQRHHVIICQFKCILEVLIKLEAGKLAELLHYEVPFVLVDWLNLLKLLSVVLIQ